jgi:hypothetical protein
MKEKLIINKVKALLGMEVAMEQLPLDNGTSIEAEVFEAGYEVFIVSEEERIALPVGDYTLEDGRKLTIVEEGIIGTIGEAVAEEEVAAETEPKAEEAVEAEKVEMSADVVREIVMSVIAELGLKKVEASKVEASAEDNMPAATVIKPNAEKKPAEKTKLSNKRVMSTLDKTLAKISNL